MPVARDVKWFPALGFSVLHMPGISRAWRFEFADGSYLLVTDLEGYDLPQAGGPYSAVWLSAQDELFEHTPMLSQTKDRYRYWQHCVRTLRNSTQPSDHESV